MTKKPSSTVQNLDYDPASKELKVTFRTGARYLYSGVDVDVFDALEKADSQGAFLKRHVIDVCQSKKLDERHERL